MTLLRSVRLKDGAPTDGYPWDLPAVRFLERIVPHPKVTFVVGNNGTGKSTVIEAMAVAAGFNAEGGNRNYQFSSSTRLVVSSVICLPTTSHLIRRGPDGDGDLSAGLWRANPVIWGRAAGSADP